MNLYLIKFTYTGTMFLVNAPTKKDALNFAMNANAKVGVINDINLFDKSYYKISIVNFRDLIMLFSKNNYYGKTDNVIIFED